VDAEVGFGLEDVVLESQALRKTIIKDNNRTEILKEITPVAGGSI